MFNRIYVKKVFLLTILSVLIISLQISANSFENYFADLGLIDEGSFNSSDVLTENEFNKWLEEVLEKRVGDNIPLDGIEDLTYGEAAVYLINALDQKEFVFTYPESQVEKLNYWKTAKILGLFDDIEHVIKINDSVTKNDGLRLLVTALERSGRYQEYTGILLEPEIYGKVNRALNEVLTVNILETEAKTLFELGNRGLFEIPGGIFTGYSVKDLSEKPIFDFARTIRYGHSSSSHLLQLLSVLRREGFDARIHIESRISSYVHLLKEWGEVPAYVLTTPVNDEKCIVHANEYDFLIEFSSMGDKEKFAGIIAKYAKKEIDGQKGLIKDSWFVPLFTSTTPLPGFEEVAEVRGKVDGYAFLSYALKDVAPNLRDQLQRINPDIQYEINTVWINKDFLSYLDSSVE